MFKNRNRPIALQLLAFFAVLTLGGAIFLFRTIVNYGYRQFGDVAQSSAKIANRYIDKSLYNYYEWQLQWLKQSSVSSSINRALEKYYRYGEVSYTVIPDEWINYQKEQLRSQFGDSAIITYTLFTGDREVIYSSEGLWDDRYNITDDFNEIKSRVGSSMDYLYRIRVVNGSVYLKLIIPVDSPYGRNFISVSASSLDINTLFNIEFIDAFPGHIYIINRQGEVFYNTSTNRGSDIKFKIPDELLETIFQGINSEEFKPISLKDETGNKVIGIGTWVEIIGSGILFTIPVDIVLGPTYYLASLILLITLSFFLLFFILLIIIDKNRVRAFDHNPLTHLPGNQVINRRIKRAFKEENQLIVYLDLDNFKAYNDTYGFAKGDAVIVFTARLLGEYISPVKKGFIGHIGGDDFVVIGNITQIKRQLEAFGDSYDKEIQKFYSKEDVERGCIEAKDRQGNPCCFPFVSISMGGFEATYGVDLHPLKIAEKCAEVKKLAKLEKGSKLVIDRRKNSLGD